MRGDERGNESPSAAECIEEMCRRELSNAIRLERKGGTVDVDAYRPFATAWAIPSLAMPRMKQEEREERRGEAR